MYVISSCSRIAIKQVYSAWMGVHVYNAFLEQYQYKAIFVSNQSLSALLKLGGWGSVSVRRAGINASHNLIEAIRTKSDELAQCCHVFINQFPHDLFVGPMERTIKKATASGPEPLWLMLFFFFALNILFSKNIKNGCIAV